MSNYRGHKVHNYLEYRSFTDRMISSNVEAVIHDLNLFKSTRIKINTISRYLTGVLYVQKIRKNKGESTRRHDRKAEYSRPMS